MSARASIPIVQITPRPLDALTSPTFIVKINDGRGAFYYVTLGVWEFNLKNATTSQERQGCEEVAELFNNGEPVEARQVIGDDNPFNAGHTLLTPTSPNQP